VVSAADDGLRWADSEMPGLLAKCPVFVATDKTPAISQNAIAWCPGMLRRNASLVRNWRWLEGAGSAVTTSTHPICFLHHRFREVDQVVGLGRKKTTGAASRDPAGDTSMISVSIMPTIRGKSPKVAPANNGRSSSHVKGPMKKPLPIT
jgi:hypothetical protein